MTAQKTPWYPGSVKPVRVGLYERDYGDPEDMDLIPDIWTGEVWLYGGTDGGCLGMAADQNRPWRGAAAPTTEEAK